jgi:hypothetical protein
MEDVSDGWQVAAGYVRQLQSLRKGSVLSWLVFVTVSPLVYVMGVIIFVVPALLLRLSVKSTVYVWLPILWALKPARHHDEHGASYLRLFLRSDLVRIVIAFSAIMIVLLVGKILLFIAGNALASDAEAWKPLFAGMQHGDRLAAFLVAFARPGEIPLWQIGSTINAILALAAFFMARGWLRRAEENIPLDDAKIDRTLGRLLQFRRLLTSYAIVCNIYAVYQLTKDLPFPTIGHKLFPWL